MSAYKPQFRVLYVDWVQYRSNISSERNRMFKMAEGFNERNLYYVHH